MAHLTIALVGLNRVSASIGLALRQHEQGGGVHQFTVIGNDRLTDREKEAHKLGAITRSEHKLRAAVESADLVITAVSYDEQAEVFRLLSEFMRPGAVVLDTAPLKQPVAKLAKGTFTAEQHLVGMTPIINPSYLFEVGSAVIDAVPNLFEDSPVLLSPASSVPREAVDLAFNFCQIIGGKPRFLDLVDHDALLAKTEQLPRLLGAAFFAHLQGRADWDDLQWLTNHRFAALTHPLYDQHPDALRDEFADNADNLARAVDSMIDTLQQFRDLLDDRPALEDVLAQIAQNYEFWLNRRHRADWDADARTSAPKGGSFMQGLFGSAIADRLQGDDDRKS